jgi:hypothetical protein
MLWPGMPNNGSTRSFEETRDLGIVYDRDANVITVSNPCCIVAVERIILTPGYLYSSYLITLPWRSAIQRKTHTLTNLVGWSWQHVCANFGKQFNGSEAAFGYPLLEVWIPVQGWKIGVSHA